MTAIMKLKELNPNWTETPAALFTSCSSFVQYRTALEMWRNLAEPRGGEKHEIQK